MKELTLIEALNILQWKLPVDTIKFIMAELNDKVKFPQSKLVYEIDKEEFMWSGDVKYTNNVSLTFIPNELKK